MTRSSKASKQRLSQADAPTHVKRKRMRARLVSDDPDLINIRTVTVRTGDEVEVVRGTSADSSASFSPRSALPSCN